MKTRSQTKAAIKASIHTVNIDFDEASAAWRANKQSIGSGSYRYVCCQVIASSGRRCGVKCAPGSVDFCRRHFKKI